MPLTKEDQEALDKRIAETVTASVQGALKAHLEATTAIARADAEVGVQKLDKVISAIDSLSGRMDAQQKRIDSMVPKKDAFSHRADSESDDDYKKRHDAEEEACKKDAMDKGDPEDVAADKARRARKDSEEAEEKTRKEKADAEAKEKADAEEKEKADAAKADADRLVGATTEIAKRLIAVERAMPKQLTDEDRHAFSAAQARADEVFTSFGRKAPYPLSGEDVLGYRKRLISTLKEHSASWKDVDVLAINDSATFKIAEDAILKDAAVAALNPADLKDDELREIVRQDSTTGTRTVSFVGRHSFVRGLTRAPRYVKSIGLRKEA